MALRTKRRHQSQPKTPTTKSNQVVESHAVQTFTEHIRELRKRLFWSVLVGLVAGTLVYTYHDFFIKLVMQPLHGQKLIYLTPTGGFSFIFMVTFYVTMLLILPFLMYQLYAFLRPAIPPKARSVPLKIVLAATLLMAMGATFGYLYAVPGGLRFLTEFASGYITPSLTAESYLSFVLGYVFGIGLLFELPLLLLFWHWIKPISPKGLLNSERYVIVGAFIAAAIISPSPDALSQTIIAVPIIIIYQLGVIAVLLSIRKARRLQKKAAKEEAKARQAQEKEPVVPARVPIPAAKPVLTVPIAPQPAPITKPQQLKRKALSLDGMSASSRHTSKTNISPKPKSIASTPSPVVKSVPRPRPQLHVPRRPSLISDFGPIRG